MNSRKTIFLLFLLLVSNLQAQEKSKQEINTTLNQWHQDAAAANFKDYFSALTEDAIFIGTDATENWNKTAFQAFAKPYFDKRKAWNFTPIERHIYFSEDGKTAWFDELLDTHMKICRGSGVVVKVKNSWKIKHYVLSMTVPNENTNEVVKIKAPIEEELLAKGKRLY
jgi:ketosteroid isomerase-like protein